MEPILVNKLSLIMQWEQKIVTLHIIAQPIIAALCLLCAAPACTDWLNPADRTMFAFAVCLGKSPSPQTGPSYSD